MINGTEPNRQERALPIDIGDLTAKLWSVEIAGGAGRQSGQQLTLQHTVIVLLAGSGTLARGDRISRMQADTVYYCMPETTFGITAEEGDSRFAVVRFGLFRSVPDSKDGLLAIASEGLQALSRDTAVEPAGRLADLCRMMHEGAGHQETLRRWKAQIALHELLYEWLAAFKSRRTIGTAQSLELAKQFIELHYGEELTIERMAGVAELSPKYFADLFKKTYGRSPLDHLTQIRMAQAKRLMLRSERRLRDIAHEVGYEDEFYFSRRFKKEHGLSPTAFMKKRERKMALYGSTSLIGYLMPLHIVPHAAPLHPKWSDYYYSRLGADIPYHLDAYRQNYRKTENLDKLAEAQPDRIICPPELEAWEKERLSGIAPFIEMPPAEAGWRHGLRTLAERLDEVDEAERFIAAYERRTAELREAAGPHALTEPVLFVRLLNQQLYVYCNSGIEDVVYRDLGVGRPEGIPDEGAFSRPLSLEQLEQLGKSSRVLLLIRQDTETLDVWKRLSVSPEWLSLSAVCNQKLRLISSNPWREYSPIAVQQIRDEAFTLLSGNCP